MWKTGSTRGHTRTGGTGTGAQEMCGQEETDPQRVTDQLRPEYKLK